MSDIRKRTGKKGVTYQLRYADPLSTTGYSYKTFIKLKEARAFKESEALRNSLLTMGAPSIQSVSGAVDKWLDICEKEGTDNNEPVTRYTMQTYRRRAEIMKSYVWPKTLQRLETPDIVEFRSWLIENCTLYIAHMSTAT